MKIKRTVKPDQTNGEAGKTEIIGEERMRNIIMQCQSLGNLNFAPNKYYGSDEGIRRLKAHGSIESFYATYELVSL